MRIDGDNEGTLDRAIRIFAGGVLLALVGVGIIGMWGLIGAIPLVTGIWGYDPFYEVSKALIHHEPHHAKAQFFHLKY